MKMNNNNIANEYREFLRTTCWYEHAHEGNAKEFAYLIFGLVGEAGEFADEFKKVIREAGFDLTTEKFRTFMEMEEHEDKLLAELGDVLWYITRLCDVLGISFDALRLMNTYKLFNRIEQGDWAPPMSVDWPFTDPFMSYENVQMNLFPEPPQE
jgi:NTP pyrophosphatase (non-canonical NTP hydrolase)